MTLVIDHHNIDTDKIQDARVQATIYFEDGSVISLEGKSACQFASAVYQPKPQLPELPYPPDTPLADIKLAVDLAAQKLEEDAAAALQLADDIAAVED